MGSDRDRRKREEKAARARRQHAANRKAKTAQAVADRLKPQSGELPDKAVMDVIANAAHEAV